MAQINLPYNNWEDGDIAYAAQVLANFNAIIGGVNSGLDTSNLADGAVTDPKIGNRTIIDTTTPVDTATMNILLNSLANRIKTITGEANWKTAPVKSLKTMNTSVATAVADSAAAVSTANTANTTANAAVVTANAADAKADTAISTSNSAVYTADSAVLIANTADGKATTAVSTLDIAVQAAENAIIIANQAVVDAQSFAGNTEIVYDVYTIVAANNGDGTFTYNNGTANVAGVITPEGYQRLILSDSYSVGRNRIEATINDTLTRSQASGGLKEVGVDGELSTTVDLTYTIDAGSEVTFKYYKQLSLGGKHGAAHGVGGSDEVIGMKTALPVEPYSGQLFFKVVG